ncbi:MAG: hypothetical protein J5714_00245 [Alphaproteobacteria bacterium]|nr:hypothetical protein [Alphaproteobacteria bacterium]
MEKIAHEYARTFSGASGRAVIEHLRKITIERTLGAHATDAELRTLEGARALVHQIETLIERGRSNAKI